MEEKIVRQGMKLSEIQRALSGFGFRLEPKGGAHQVVHSESDELLRHENRPIIVSQRKPLDGNAAKRINTAVAAFLASRKK